MSLSRADFNALAAALSAVSPLTLAAESNGLSPEIDGQVEQFRRDCSAIAYTLATTNTLFDRLQFLAACGLPVYSSKE